MRKRVISFLGVLLIFCLILVGCDEYTSDNDSRSSDETTENVEKTSNETVDTRQQREPSDMYTVTVGLQRFQISDYWVQQKESPFNAYAESGEAVASLDIKSDYDSEDPVGFEWYDTEEKQKELIDAMFTSMWFNGMRNTELISTEVLQDSEEKGILWTFRGNIKKIDFKGQIYMYPSFEDNNWVFVSCTYTDNTEYCYDDEFRRIINSIEKTPLDDESIIIPKSASKYSGSNYEDVKNELLQSGFLNVSTEAVYDIVFGFTAEGSVGSVYIDGNGGFAAGDVFNKNADVKIVYHMKEENDPNKPETPPQTSSAGSSNNKTDPDKEQEEEIITKENNEEFAALLTADSVSANKQAAFSQKYRGKIIEFDCLVMTINNKPNSKWIATYIIVPGEDADSIGSALFMVEDASFQTFKWDKATKPEYLAPGSKIRLQAKISYGDDDTFINLYPIKTWGR